MKQALIIIAAALLAITRADAKQEIPFIDAAPFDTIVDGKQIKLYTITNGTVGAQVTNFGAFIVTVFAPDRDGNYANLVTSYGNIRQYLRYNLGQVGPAVGRYANRISGAQFTLDGKTYELTRNNGRHTLHSGNQGFDHTIWDVVSAAKDKLVLKCISPDGTDGFPGTLTTTLTYSITKDGGLKVEYEATTDRPTVVSTTTHSYFNLNGVGNGDILGHQLQIMADNITESDRDLIPTGKLTPVDGTPYDFRKPVTLSERQVAVQGFGFGFGQRVEIPEGKVRQYDTNFCLNHTDPKKVEKVAEVYAPESGRVMEVWNNHPGLQLYTGARTSIALESQMYPDTPNRPEFPSARLDPGQKYQHTCIYKFSVR